MSLRDSRQRAAGKSVKLVRSPRVRARSLVGWLVVLGFAVLAGVWSLSLDTGVGVAADSAKGPAYKPVAPLDVLMYRAEDLLTKELDSFLPGKVTKRKFRQAAAFGAELMNVTAHYSGDFEKPEKWVKMAHDTRDMLLEIQAAAKKKDKAKVLSLLGEKGKVEEGKLYQSCEACHAVYRDA